MRIYNLHILFMLLGSCTVISTTLAHREPNRTRVVTLRKRAQELACAYAKSAAVGVVVIAGATVALVHLNKPTALKEAVPLPLAPFNSRISFINHQLLELFVGTLQKDINVALESVNISLSERKQAPIDERPEWLTLLRSYVNQSFAGDKSRDFLNAFLAKNKQLTLTDDEWIRISDHAIQVPTNAHATKAGSADGQTLEQQLAKQEESSPRAGTMQNGPCVIHSGTEQGAAFT